MNITVVTQPQAEPVTLEDVYTHLRLDPEDSPPTHPDDDMLSRHITTARIEVEQITRRSLVEQTLRMSLSGFPCFQVRFGYDDDYYPRPGYVELLRPPVLSVLSVKYYDFNNVLQTVDSDEYFVTDDFVPKLQFKDTFAVPETYKRDDAVRVEYVTGYTPEGSPPEDYAANIPGPIKDAILLGVQLLYDQLSPEQRKAIESARNSLLYSFKVHSF